MNCTVQYMVYCTVHITVHYTVHCTVLYTDSQVPVLNTIYMRQEGLFIHKKKCGCREQRMCTIYCKVQFYSVQYSDQYSVEFSIRYNLQEAGKGLLLSE